MRLLAQGHREPLPDAKIVWLRAQIAGETAGRDRVLAPVMLARILVQVIISVCSAGWLFWKWPEIGSALTRLVATYIRFRCRYRKISCRIEFQPVLGRFMHCWRLSFFGSSLLCSPKDDYTGESSM